MQPIELDIRTLSFVTVLFAFGLGAGLISFALVQRAFNGLIRVGVGFTCLGLGFMLIGLRDHIPAILSVVTANTLLLICFVLTNRGIRVLLDVRQTDLIACLALLITNIVVFVYYTYFEADIPRRIFWISLFMAFFFGDVLPKRFS